MGRPIPSVPRRPSNPAVIAFEAFTILLALGALAIMIKVSPL